MSDVLQTIADVDCGNAFVRFDSSEFVTLRRYHELCDALGNSGFLSHGVKFTFKASKEESYEKLEHAGEAELRSAMMYMRQFWLNNDRTHFPTVRNMLRRNAVAKGTEAAQEAVEQMNGIGRRYKKALKVPLMSFVDPKNPIVPVKNVTAEDVINDWLNAGPFHYEEESAARVQQWSQRTFEFSLTKALYRICDVYWELDLLVQGILAEPNLVGEDE